MKWPLGRYANYLQLDVHTPSAVTASTTGIAVTQSVIELTAATAVALVRSPCVPRNRTNRAKISSADRRCLQHFSQPREIQMC